MRHVKPELVKIIDGKISNPSSDPTTLLRQALASLVGTHEEGGNNRGQLVELFQGSIGTPVKQAWCMDFLQAVVGYVEQKLGVTCDLLATEGTQALADWAAAQGKLIPHPFVDSMVVWKHTAPGSTGGHVGYVMGVARSDMTTVEGNTSAESHEIVREGDVVAMKSRPLSSSPNMIIRGFVPVTFTAKKS